MEGVWVHWLGVRGTRCCVILVIRECIWIALVVQLVLPAFDHTCSIYIILREPTPATAGSARTNARKSEEEEEERDRGTEDETPYFNPCN